MKEEITLLYNEKNYKKIKKIFSTMPASDIAEVLSDFKTQQLASIFRIINKDIAVDVFAYLDVSVSSELLEYLPDKDVVNLMDEMHADDAADILEEMPANIVDKILKMCSEDTRQDINKLLNYAEDSAGSIMTVEYAELKSTLSIKEAISKLKEEIDSYETINTCFVVDKNRKIVGDVKLSDILFADKKAKVGDICNKNIHYVTTSTDQEEVTEYFKKYDLTVMPVVDSESRLVGIITIDDIVDVMDEEATEDMKKMAAIIPVDKPYSKLTIPDIFLARIPWLLLLMISATFTGSIIENYESQLATCTILTAFIPMLMDTGGNAGGQASVSIIRALSLNDIEFKDIFKVIFKEFRVALLCALTLALCNFVKMLLIDKVSIIVALCVCL